MHDNKIPKYLILIIFFSFFLLFMSIFLHTSRIPLLPGLQELLAQWVYPDSTTRNYQAQQSFVSGWGELDFLWACDPQTNGGLLISVSPDDEENLIKTAQAAGVSPNCLVCIGELLPWQEVPVIFSAD